MFDLVENSVESTYKFLEDLTDKINSLLLDKETMASYLR